MTQRDRASLERLVRKRGKLAQANVAERVQILQADVEGQLAAKYKIDDELWADVNRQAVAEVAKADRQVAAICRRLGIPEHLRPELLPPMWSSRGENAQASRRAELRKLAYKRIDAAAASAKVAIESSVVAVETELIVGGLDTGEARQFVESMPTPEQLMPTVQVGELAPGEHDDEDNPLRRYHRWEPPQEAAGELLTPSTASNREEKRQAIAAALAAGPDVPILQIANRLGVDPKTVRKVRAEGGEIPRESGEIPSGAGLSEADS